jgi:TolB-like protein
MFNASGAVPKKSIKIIIFLPYILIMAAVWGCASEPNTSPAPNTPISRGLLYSGDGGKNTKIAVLQPQMEDIAPEEQWISAYIQGVLTSDFNKYTAMTVIDRQNLDKIIDNQDFAASGYFSDDDYISIGNMLNAEYILIGSLRKIPQDGSFMLDLSVSHAGTGQRIASFIPSGCNFKDIQNTSIIQRAFEDLAGQLGIILTEYGKQSLRAVNNTEIAAGTSLSKGIIAQKNQRIGEALSYYYNAASFSPAMPEIQGRISKLSSSVSSGSLGEDVRNLIAWRNAWKNVLDECDRFLENHIPFEIIYDTDLKQVGDINYEAGTIDLSFSIMTKPADGFKMINDVLNGLKKTRKQEEWGFQFWPFGIHELRGPVYNGNIDIFSLEYWWGLVYGGLSYGATKALYIDRSVKIKAILVNDNGKIISTKTGNLDCRMGAIIYAQKLDKSSYAPLDQRKLILRPEIMRRNIIFDNIKAEDITEFLTIKLDEVDGIEAETAFSTGYIKISQGNI